MSLEQCLNEFLADLNVFYRRLYFELWKTFMDVKTVNELKYQIDNY